VILWLTIGYGVVFMMLSWWVSLILLGVATGVTIHIARVKTASPADIAAAKIADSDDPLMRAQDVNTSD
jgi:hypothetical protein